MLGLPAAGKTTFLAALWHLGNSAEADISYKVDFLEGNLKYLNFIGRAWAECSQMPHTQVSRSETTVLRVRDASGEALRLTIPDLSGELFRQGIKDRAWDDRIAKPTDDAEGLLMFVNPAIVTEPSWIFEDPSPAEPLTEGPLADWSSDLIPSQVQLVDLLQSIRYLRDGRSVRVALVISAWDAAAQFYEEPGRWLSDRIPLLDQYLITNAETFPSKVFGVSAQGGSLPAEESRLLQLPPEQRPFVVEGLARAKLEAHGDVARSPHDLAAPIRWLLPPRA